MHSIIYIHGAGATSRSFQWLTTRIPSHASAFIDYDMNDTMTSVNDRVFEAIRVCKDRDVTLVGHSMGGVLAASCSTNQNVSRVVTLNAPFGGLPAARMAAFFNQSGMLRDLSPSSSHITRLRNMALRCPILSVVGTSGLPFMFEPNDGAITVASQKIMRGPRYVEVELNHFETLLDQTVADLISDFIAEPVA